MKLGAHQDSWKSTMISAEIREKLATELRLDLIGPGHSDAALVGEVLPD